VNDYELKREFDIAPLAGSPASEDDVVELWLRDGGLGEEEARRRLTELSFAGTAPDGALAGVTTAYLAHQRRLGMNLWHARVFVAPQFRSSNLAVQLMKSTRLDLREGFREGREPTAPGIVVEVENPGVERAFPQAVWPVNHYTFIGITENGWHLRVLWFDGARAPITPPAGS
jgi:hypothetical protein